MPVDAFVFTVPLCCFTGVCAHQVFYWNKVLKSRKRRSLPNGVVDDTNWIPPRKQTEKMPSMDPYRDVAYVDENSEVVQRDPERIPSRKPNMFYKICQTTKSVQKANFILKRNDGLEELQGLNCNQGDQYI